MINLSFAGCGFLGIYHVGVASCFREYAPHVLVSKIAGASVGSIAAAALICDVSLGQTTTDILAVAVKARSSTLGPLSPRFDLNKILRERLENALPANAHQICSGRLFISVTRWKDRKNVLLSQFNTREELIQAILCSCFIPGYSGLALPVFQGEYYVDGGMSDNLPVLDDNTVTVSPFAGEHDICPQDESCNILQVNFGNTSIAVSPGNMFRLLRILFPPKPEILSKMCQQGFDDALKFLQRKNVISCTRCLGVRSVIKITKRSTENDVESGHSGLDHEFDSCKECKKKRQKANFGNLPDAVVSAIQDACDQVNKGIFNWLFRHRPMKILALLGLPYTIPLDISIVIFTKIWQKLPDFRKELMSKFDFVISLTKQLLSKLDEKKIYRAIFQCELSITEFNYSEDNVTSSYANPFHNMEPHETCKIKSEEERTPKRKFSIRRTSSVQPPPDVGRRQQRKSYAGFPNNGYQQEIDSPARRKSFSEINQPERVIRNLKIGFSVGMASGISQNDKNSDLFQSLKSLGDADSELNIVELAKKAVGMEHDYIHQHYSKIKSQKDSGVNKAIDPTDSDPLMSYCYMDEDNTIKINEIYNVTDADTSLVLHDEERQVNNKLQWESNWINPPEFQQTSNVSVVDTLDDHEFDTSDNEYDLTDNNEVFTVSRSNSVSENNNNVERINILKPPRKTSFIIVK